MLWLLNPRVCLREEGPTAGHLRFSLCCQSSLGLLTGRPGSPGEELLALQGVLFWGPHPSDPLSKAPAEGGLLPTLGRGGAGSPSQRECSLEAGQVLRQHRRWSRMPGSTAGLGRDGA